MCGLRSFEIYIHLDSATTGMYNFNIFKLSFLMGSLNISLTSPTTPEHLEFNIRFRDYINHFNSYRFYDNLRDADVWSHLDSIATHLAGSRLRVDTNIDYAFRHNDHWEELDEDVNYVMLKAVKAILGGKRSGLYSRTLSAARISTSTHGDAEGRSRVSLKVHFLPTSVSFVALIPVYYLLLHFFQLL